MNYLGICPKCGNKIEIRKKEVNGKKVQLYACEKANWTTEDGDFFELTKDSTCDFKIWQNSLSKYGYHRLKHSEVRKILNQEDVIVELKSKNIKYKKYIVLNLEYGVSVLFDTEVK